MLCCLMISQTLDLKKYTELETRCLFLSNIPAPNILYSGIHVSDHAGGASRRACSFSYKVYDMMLHHFSQDQIYKFSLFSDFNEEWNLLTNFVKCATVKFNIIHSVVLKLFYVNRQLGR